jgi:adenylate cyclase
VLFATDDVRAGVGVALDLAETFGAETPTPVRVGFVWGRVLSRFGDVFGAPVNTAARLTEEAAPGTVLVDEATAALLAGDGLALEPLAAREVDGLGALSPVQVRRAR